MQNGIKTNRLELKRLDGRGLKLQRNMGSKGVLDDHGRIDIKRTEFALEFEELDI